MLGHPTINVGSIAGGRQPNIVPDHCVISVDRRTVPGETDAGVKREIRGFLRQHNLAARMSDSKGVPCHPLETKLNAPLVQQFLNTVGQTRSVGVDYFSDAGVLAHGGISSVVFGPGDIAQAHTPDEWIAVDQLARATRLLVRFLQSLP